MKAREPLNQRRVQRSAVMVEALDVIPFFLIIFASILFISALYNQTLFTQRASMAKSW